jgi:hypothetical protein
MNVPLSFAWHMFNKALTVTPHNSTNHILHTTLFFITQMVESSHLEDRKEEP